MHSSYTLGKERDSGRLGRKTDETRGNKAKRRKKPNKNWLKQRLKSEASQHQTSISSPEASPQQQWVWKLRGRCVCGTVVGSWPKCCELDPGIVEYSVLYTVFYPQHSMLYFFHHYELPAILQQAQIQQLGRVHTVNIVLRNVPNNNNNNNQNTPNNPGNAGGGENVIDDRGGANLGPTGIRAGAGGGGGGGGGAAARPNVFPMVNLVFRNMTAGMANNRNGNASLSFVFRNVRNIVQSLQQNNTSSTTATNVTTTTTTVTSQTNTTTTNVTASNAAASHENSASDLAPSISRVLQSSAPPSSTESTPIPMPSVSFSNITPSTPLASTSVASDSGVSLNSHNVADVNLLSTSMKEKDQVSSPEFSTQSTSDISFQPHSSSSSSINSSSSGASSSSSLHNQRASESTISPPQDCSQGSPDYMAVPVGMPKHVSHSQDHERVQYSKASESSDMSIRHHSCESTSHLSDKSSREPHNNTWSGVEDSRSYDVPRPPEQMARRTMAHHHLDDNSSN